MKIKFLIYPLIFLLAFGLNACSTNNNNKSPDSLPKNKNVNSDIDSNQSNPTPAFEIKTIPLGNEYRNEIIYFKHLSAPKDSLLIFLDPQGNGKKPLKKYKNLYFENYDAMASNFSRNGVELIEVAKHIKRALLAVKSYKKVIIIGFSGGGRQAFFSAYSLFNEHPEISAISCGSSMHNPRFKAEVGFDYQIIIGLKDFNFAEIVNLNKQRKFKVYTGDFGHYWPDDSVLNIALNSVYYEPHFALKNQQLTNKEMKENSLRQLNLPEKPLSWWENHILSLQSFNEIKNELYYKSQRQLAYLEFVTYLYIQKSIDIAAIQEINKGLSIMKAINPNNPDIYILSAKKALIENNQSLAINQLNIALENGFVNTYLLFEDPILRGLQNNVAFANIINQIERKMVLP